MKQRFPRFLYNMEGVNMSHTDVGIPFNEVLDTLRKIHEMADVIHGLVANGFNVRVILIPKSSTISNGIIGGLRVKKRNKIYVVEEIPSDLDEGKLISALQEFIRLSGTIRGIVEVLEEVPV